MPEREHSRGQGTHLMVLGLKLRLEYLFFLLTVIILAFPTNFEYTYSTVQSIEIFGNLSLFLALMLLWVLCLGLVLIQLDISSKNLGFLLALSVAMVSIGFWVLRTSFPLPHSDGVENYAYILSALKAGHLIGAGSSSMTFFVDWPAMNLLSAGLAKVSGLSIVDAMDLVVLILLFACLSFLYQVAFSLLKSAPASTLACSIFFVGSIYGQQSVYTPQFMGLPLVLMVIWLLGPRDVSDLRRQRLLILIMVFITLSFTNDVSMLFALSSLVAFALFYGKESLARVTLPFAAMAIVMPYLYNKGLSFVVSYATIFLQRSVLTDLSVFLSSKVGGVLPSWVSFSTAFWQASFALVAIIGLVRMVIIRKRKNHHDKFVMVFLVGTISFGLILLAAGTLFSNTFIFLAISSSILIAQLYGWLVKKRVGLALIIMLFLLVMSIPTFFAYNRNTEVYKLYPRDVSMTTYLSSYFQPYSGSLLNTQEDFQLPIINNDAFVANFAIAGSPTSQALWQNWNGTLNALETTNAVLVFSPRSVIPWMSLFSVSPQNPRWNYILTTLSKSDITYSNGFDLTYASTSK
ncbi:MAG: hypothetical protein JRN20_21780 [Nitrososphaerota archaeon]|nr:hypothetical protein [Nitrososphaerota archaeon]